MDRLTEQHDERVWEEDRAIEVGREQVLNKRNNVIQRTTSIFHMRTVIKNNISFFQKSLKRHVIQ